MNPFIHEDFVPGDKDGHPIRVTPDEPTPDETKRRLNAKCLEIARAGRKILNIVRHYNCSSELLYGFFIYSEDPEAVA